MCVMTSFSDTPHANVFSANVKRMLTMLFEGPYTMENGTNTIKVLLASPALLFVNAVSD